jgi:hypothetical protein
MLSWPTLRLWAPAAFKRNSICPSRVPAVAFRGVVMGRAISDTVTHTEPDLVSI